MMPFITALVIGLTLQNNPNYTGNAVSVPTTNAVQLYDIKNKAVQKYDITGSERYQQKNKEACDLYRNNIYEYSGYLESDIAHGISPHSATESVKKFLNGFNKHHCAENNYISPTDRDLIKKLEKDLTKK
jgi:hypothetical protein